MADSFGARGTLRVADRTYEIYRIAALADRHEVATLPWSLKILLENLLRHEDGVAVTAEQIEAVAGWRPQEEGRREIAFTPARVLLQDFTGVPAVVDLAAMRDAMAELGGDPARINPLRPAELVIDHSVQVDAWGRPDAVELNARIEFERNRERYAFLRWGQQAFGNFRVVPPDTGIVHQVNLEHLARVVFAEEADGTLRAFPDTLVGTDSHTTMVNGLGVLGWGVGGIEAEAALLGQPVSMLVPDVVGVRLTGALPEGATATDLVLTVTERLRRHGVVGKFVEFFGPGLDHLTLADRATLANMAPEYGATCGLFPIDAETLRYLRLTGRDEAQVALVEAYAREQGLFREPGLEPRYTAVVEVDMGAVEPSLAGPRRPQDRVPLRAAAASVRESLAAERGDGDGEAARFEEESGHDAPERVPPHRDPCAAIDIGGERHELRDGAVVIAAITSCTNTSNPEVMLAAGLLARRARARGLRAAPWVKTSLAPGSRVVTEYLRESGLLEDLAAVGFHVVGYGCTTCIGNSGPLPEPVAEAIREHGLVTCAVLSGNRNFEGRIHPDVRLNYLASPPLVVAYALAGRMDLDLAGEPLGTDADGRPILLRDLWPSRAEIAEAMRGALRGELFRRAYAEVFRGDAHWNSLEVPRGERFAWDPDSTYVRRPPFFEGMAPEPEPVGDIRGARALVVLGDSVTTDHISPAGAIKPGTPAAAYLEAHGVRPADFNSYGARRGNHEVMMRGTFANVRLRNRLVDREGGWTLHLPDGELMTVYDAAMRYREEGVPLIVLAGREYGSGSSRDWAAKGPRLLGVRAVLAQSYERIHRTNLVCMGVLPLEFPEGESAESLGLTGRECFDIEGLAGGEAREVTVRARADDGRETAFRARVRIDTPKEREYFRHGGILHYVLRSLAR